MEQKNQIAYQFFDAKHRKAGVLDKYKNPTVYNSNNLLELAKKNKNNQYKKFSRDIDLFNKNISSDIYNPHTLDGRSNRNINPSRSIGLYH